MVKLGRQIDVKAVTFFVKLGAPKDEEFIVKEWGCNP